MVVLVGGLVLVSWWRALLVAGVLVVAMLVLLLVC